ncbi:hypothetical protein [Marinibactrum halimedae]|nr:hypothetical protein [Marinibactrum halimedae]MCD9460582.1 hypothetical protein [Marinibactrum halimedae]
MNKNQINNEGDQCFLIGAFLWLRSGMNSVDERYFYDRLIKAFSGKIN